MITTAETVHLENTIDRNTCVQDTTHCPGVPDLTAFFVMIFSELYLYYIVVNCYSLEPQAAILTPIVSAVSNKVTWTQF